MGEEPNDKKDSDKKNANKNLLEIAKRKRQIYLIEKLQKGKPLSAAELKEIEELDAGTSLPLGCVRTQSDVAKALKVSVRTVQHWVRDGLPRTRDNFYNLIEVQAWRQARNEKGLRRSELNEHKEEWDGKYREYRAKLQLLELEKAQGGLINRDEVETGWAARAYTLKQLLLALPNAVAPLCAHKDAREIQVIIRDKVYEVINEYAHGELIDPPGAK